MMLPICQSLGDQSAREEGLGQMIAQAWQQHERDRVLVSKSPKDALEVFSEQWHDAMNKGLNEAFVSTIQLSTAKPFVSEVYTDTQRV